MDALTISTTGWHPKNVERVLRALEVSSRNEAIRAAFLGRPDDSDPEVTKEEIAKRYHVSPATVDKAIWPR